MMSLLCPLVMGGMTPPPRTYAEPAALPIVSELPDPFLRANGTRLRHASEWRVQRKELLAAILHYQYGPLPPKGGKVTAEPLSARPLPDGVGEAREVRLRMGSAGRVTARLLLAIPTGAGPFPVIVDGDLGWGRLSDTFLCAIVRRGYALAAFNREEVGPDSAERKGVYEAWPKYDGGRLSAWAWGFHRTIDYLLTLREIHPKQIVVTGHSRGGKAALLAGATDERVAVTAPNNSGCGGAGNYRFLDGKCEDLEAIVRRFPYWFHARFAEFIGRVDRLPFDQHTLKACVAPRALLTTEALGDQWANPKGTQQTYQAAKVVYEWLGVPERIGIRFRPGPHEHNLGDFDALMDFCDAQFAGRPLPAAFSTLAFPNAERVWSWSAPQ